MKSQKVNNLINLTKKFPHDTRLFVNQTVYCTQDAWEKIKSATRQENLTDFGVYVWDICHMAAYHILSQKIDPDFLVFEVRLPFDERVPATTVTLEKVRQGQAAAGFARIIDIIM